MNPQQPDDNPQTPMPPAPEQPVVDPETPVVTPPQPVTLPDQPVPSEQPVASAPPSAMPVPMQPPAPSGPAVFGSGPDPAPTPMSPSRKKLIRIITAVIGGLVVLGIGAWLLLTFVLNTIALERYDSDTYSILVPAEYSKEGTGSAVAFNKPGTDIDTRSAVNIMRFPFDSTAVNRDEMIKLYDQSLDENSVAGSFSSGNEEVSGYKNEKTTHQGSEARKISFDITKDGQNARSASMLVVFGDNALYMITIAAHSTDTGLAKAANKILDSLEIKK